MSLPASVAEVKESIVRRFLHNASDFDEKIETEIDDWIRVLAQSFPYWFLTIYPGAEIIPQFPITDLTTLTPLAGRWVAEGWLVTEAGVATYDFYHPLERDEATDPSWWAPCKLSRLDFVSEFTKDGAYGGRLSTPEYESALIGASYKSRARPRVAMWHNTETKAQITFNPTPDKAYLYAMQFSIKDPPTYQDGVDPDTSDPILRNRFITGASEAVILYGLYKYASHVGEGALKKDYGDELWGEGNNLYGGQAGRLGGLLGLLQKETLRKNQTARRMMEQWQSMARAQGQIPHGYSEKQRIWGRGRGNRYR